MMSTTLSHSHVAGLVGSFFVHVAAVVVGFVLMIVGLGLGVTIMMLPVGLVVGIIGLLMFVGGLFARVGARRIS
jgi:hypothetical protein